MMLNRISKGRLEKLAMMRLAVWKVQMCLCAYVRFETVARLEADTSETDSKVDGYSERRVLEETKVEA